jgi:MoaA/NifB/PqqE/SkfB family radical SAM enzyme
MTAIPKTPRVLWIELTSKCPYDCVFCSRKLRRGSGEHLPFWQYQRLLSDLDAPRKLLLNYSGESLVYPHLIPAIRLGRERGAIVELVSAFSLIEPHQAEDLARSGLNRLTISIHTVDPDQYVEIYGHSSYAKLAKRLEEFLDICRTLENPPQLDVAFVAMQRNMDQLSQVAALAERLNIGNITVFPVIRRDPISESFTQELASESQHSDNFRANLVATAREVRNRNRGVNLRISNPAFESPNSCLGEVPLAFPGSLPAGARIYTCEQNPHETAHVLSNGDVVVCEVNDKISMGNLFQQSIREIWNGQPYQDFRNRYHVGCDLPCANCVFKVAYLPTPAKSDILGRDGRTAQLGYGWHTSWDEDVIWASQEAVATLRPRAGSRSIHVSGLLPPGPTGAVNELVVTCNDEEIGRVLNTNDETMPFGLDFQVESGVKDTWTVGFQTKHVFRPCERGTGPDTRDLGFGLVLLTSKRFVETGLRSARERKLDALHSLIRWTDANGARLQRTVSHWHHSTKPPLDTPGVSIVIPERNNQ